VVRAGSDLSQSALREQADALAVVLADFGIRGEVKDIHPGPVVTLFEFEPARGIKSSRVIALADDIARSMSSESARVAVVPGRNAIGIELPNAHRETVFLRELFESEAFRSGDAILPLVLGKSINGTPVFADLVRMPHLLVAGTTGSGKSVGINSMILSLLHRLSPEQCRFLMIDPKMLELSVYNGIPHLLAPVVTDARKAVAALNWVVGEMENRYRRMASISVRNIDVFNNRVRSGRHPGGLEPMPYIVVVVDEFADLMSVAGKEIEAAVQRLAQMARAAGIHLIMATQRPSVDVITGTIKANFPTRISFKVASKVDSRTILNEQGAEQLLGQGDMLFSAGTGRTLRVHAAFVSDEEVESITAYLREQGEPRYVEGITDTTDRQEDPATPARPGAGDLYDRAVAIVRGDQKASTSYLQRRLGVGYNRAADLVERMEREGVLSPPTNQGRREILASEAVDPAAAARRTR
jgi:S-DNA-T family DNA segregation ATPase FtsK/SpoIIIE